MMLTLSNMIRRACACVLALGMAAMPLYAATWFALGPYGGDARCFAVDPHNAAHLFLGTATGWIFESADGGKDWKRLSRVGKRDDLVVDHILVDPADAKHLVVGGWVVDRPDGGLFESHDGGMTWYSQAEMRGQSVRALASAPSNPRMMVAGTLQGVYRTMDSGAHWTLISPQGSTEIHEVESIAVDPVNPLVIYAGTWHLPWKTADGGVTWTSIKQGITDDSDVFSIIVDPKMPQVVYASACSGIYKSADAGAKFNKVQGIPFSARRTRKLMQDPLNSATVFAGTTEGLYRTQNSGTAWSRLTGPDVIVNDVFVDPTTSSHVLLATDRAGVLASEDGGLSFQASNTGFSARQVTSIVTDPRRTSTVYAGVVNDKDSGGVFVSADGGASWQQQSAGLGGRDVFSMATLSDGTLLAGTSHGIFRLTAGTWTPSGMLPAPAALAAPANLKPVVASPAPKGGKLSSAAFQAAATGRAQGQKKRAAAPLKPVVPLPPPSLDAAVYAMAATVDTVYAGTSEGLFQGTGNGTLWTPVTSLQMPETRFVAAQKQTVIVASLRRIELSVDGGTRWDAIALPADLTRISTVAVDEMNNLWVGGLEGIWFSTDYGLNWKQLRNLYMTQVTGIYFDPVEHRVLVSAINTPIIFAAHLPDYKVNYWDSGWNLRFVRPTGDHLIGATMFDGVVVQPMMVDSKMVGSKMVDSSPLASRPLDSSPLNSKLDASNMADAK